MARTKGKMQIGIVLPISTINRYDNMALDKGVSRESLLLQLLIEADPEIANELAKCYKPNYGSAKRHSRQILRQATGMTRKSHLANYTVCSRKDMSNL